MNNFVIWLDTQDAKIFELKPEGIEKSHVKKSGPDHHHNKKDQVTDSQLGHYFDALAEKIKSADQILLLGPSLGKNHFKTHLESHKSGLASKIIGMENLENVSEKQILEASRTFFKEYDRFN